MVDGGERQHGSEPDRQAGLAGVLDLETCP
jgi:hypothetical protein